MPLQLLGAFVAPQPLRLEPQLRDRRQQKRTRAPKMPLRDSSRALRPELF